MIRPDFLHHRICYCYIVQPYWRHTNTRARITLSSRSLHFWQTQTPLFSKTIDLINDKSYVLNMLKEGSDKARDTANKYLTLARKNVGLNYTDF